MGRAIFINKIWYSITIIISLQISEYLFVYHIKHYYYEKSLFIHILESVSSKTDVLNNVSIAPKLS